MKKNPKTLMMLVALAAVAVSPLSSRAQLLYSDQMNNGSGWGTNSSSADFAATFNYDYSADGIPEAPNTQGGDDATRGVKLESNITNGVGQFFTLYPLGQNFTGSYKVRFDAWMNFGGSGTTEFLGGGLGYNNTDADLTSGAQAIATGDGGSSQDWRAFDNGTYFPLGNGSTEPYVSFLPSTNGSVAGSPGLQWVTWEFNTVAGEVTIFIEKPDKSRLELDSFVSTNSTDGNLSLFYADFFASIADPSSAMFGVIDNVTVSNIPVNAVSISATDPSGDEEGPDSVTIQFTRTITGSPLTVNYSIDGTAQNGVDYTNQLGGALSGSVTFGSSDSAVNLVIVPIDDSISEPEEDIIITVEDGTGYVGVGSATGTIADNDTPLLIVSPDAATMFERHTNDYASVSITRWGDLAPSISINSGNFTFGGSAVQNTDYVVNSDLLTTNLTDVKTVITNVVNPLDNGSFTGNKTIEVGLVAGGGFAVSNATATLTILDDENPAATALYSNPLTDSGDASNWKVASIRTDYEASFGYDLSTSTVDVSPVAPPPSGAGTALRATVNKVDGLSGAVNLYMTNMTFSGNYAVRFNMNLIQDNDAAFSTHGPIFGINHDGNETNWWAGSASRTIDTNDMDGLWYWISADGGAAAGDYMLYTGLGGAVPNAGWTRQTTLYQDAFYKQFKGKGGILPEFEEPGPYTTFLGPGLVCNDWEGEEASRAWTDVEIKQLGDVVTLYLNKSPVITYTNTTTFKSGYLMLGYLDPFSSLGTESGAAYYSNLRVVELLGPEITDISLSGSDVTLSFTSNDGTAGADDFTVESASEVGGPYAAVDGAVITQTGPGVYEVQATVSGDQQYFRISQ